MTEIQVILTKREREAYERGKAEAVNAALNSDKAERVLASTLINRYGIYMNSEWRADAIAILAALREGLAE